MTCILFGTLSTFLGICSSISGNFDRSDLHPFWNFKEVYNYYKLSQSPLRKCRLAFWVLKTFLIKNLYNIYLNYYTFFPFYAFYASPAPGDSLPAAEEEATRVALKNYFGTTENTPPLPLDPRTRSINDEVVRTLKSKVNQRSVASQ